MKKRVIAWMVIVSLLLSTLPFPAFAATPSEIEEQIEETYEEALDRAEKSSFDGYCGDYVNWHLLVLGINTTNVAGHGKDQYDNYKNLNKSSGGYPITAYSAKNYSLKSALNHVTNYGTRDVYNILAGFQKTSSSPRYGHAFFIHAIIDGIVYYSESFDCSIDGTRYREGSVIACSIDQMATYYGYWATFEGIIHFGELYPTEMTLTGLEMPDVVVQGAAPGLKGNVKFHRTIEQVWVGVDHRGTSDHVVQAQWEPKSYTYDITGLLAALDLKKLPGGEYTLKVRATGDGRDWQLYSQDFTVYPTEVTLTGLEMPDSIVEGTAPTLTGEAAYYQTIDRLWVGIDHRGTTDHVTQAQWEPKANTCDITELLAELDFEGLAAGEYTLNVRATGGGRDWQLYSQDFAVYPTEMMLTGLEMPDVMTEGTAPALTGDVMYYRTINWLWIGVDTRGTMDHIIQVQCHPKSNAYDIRSLLSQLDLEGLPAGEYTLSVHATGGDQYWQLYAQDFTVYPLDMTLTGLEMPDSIVEGTAPALTGNVAYHQTINWLWVGVDTRGTMDHITQAQCHPKSNTYDIRSLLSELDFEGLAAGEYTLSVHATGGGQYWQLCAQDFTVEKPYMNAEGIDFPDFYLQGESPSIQGTIKSNHVITWVWTGVDHRDTGMTVTEAEWDPMAYEYSIGSITAELDFAGLEAGEYTYRVEGISGDEHYVLYEKDFTVFYPTEERPFADVQADSFCYDPVLWAVENGVTQGITNITFGPDEACNRAQVVTFLWRVEGCPEPTVTTHSFVDVQAGSYYEQAVLWAVENGITTGADDTHFNPMGECNRAQVVTFLQRTFESSAEEDAENPFADVPGDVWYTAPVLWAVEMGITNGLTDTEFGPNANCNRAQVVTFLYRAYNG